MLRFAVLAAALGLAAVPLISVEARAAEENSNCVKESSGFRQDGERAFFQTELQNGCGKRMRCKVYVSITSSRESVRREGALLLAAKGPGATKSHRVPLRAAGGMAQGSHQCRAA